MNDKSQSELLTSDQQYQVLLDLARSELLSRGDVDLAAARISEAATKALKVGRASVWLIEGDPPDLVCRHMYMPANDSHRTGIHLPTALCPRYCKSLDDHRLLVVEDALTHPLTAELVDVYLKPEGIGAVLDAPIYLDGKACGVVCTAHHGGPRQWRDEERSFAAAMADMMRMVLEASRRRQAEESLRDMLLRYRLAVNAGGIGVWQWEAHTGQFTADPILLRLLGMPEDGPSPLRPAWDTHLSAGDRAALLAAIDAVAQGKRNEFTIEHQLTGCEGSTRWVLTRGQAVRHEDGRIERYLGTMIDITERKMLEEQLLQSQKMEAIGKLAGGIAHDFNNSLQVIHGYTEMLAKRVGTQEPLRKYVRLIGVAGQRASELTRQLLTFSRKQVIRPALVNLNSLLAETELMLHRVIGEHIHIVRHACDHLDLVRADPGQMVQVMMNLALNARDAMPDGGTLTFATDNFTADEDSVRRGVVGKAGRYVSMTVSDTGCGMPDHIRQKIFDPFFTTKDMGKGTGLGLSTVYAIIQNCDGTINVSSEPGKGATFTILLPQQDGVIATKEASGAHAMTPGSETILLVEDEQDVRELAGEVLRSAGYRVLEASGGSEAMKLNTSEPVIDLVIADMVMPGISGRALVRELRLKRPTLRVLYASGYTGFQNEVSGTEERYQVIEDFLQKPYSSTSLIDMTRMILDRSECTPSE